MEASDAVGNTAYALSNRIDYDYQEPDPEDPDEPEDPGGTGGEPGEENSAPTAVIVADIFAEQRVEYLY